MPAALLLWGALWEIAGRLELVPILPPLSDVLIAMGQLVHTGQFWAGARTTLASFATGMGLAIAIGIPLGMLMGRIEMADRLLGMWVNLFASAPLTALVPVLMILFGLGSTTVVVTVTLFAVWIIALDTAAGMKHVNPSLLEMARSFGASRWVIYGRILPLAALPEILAGIRLGLIRGVKGVVIGQLLVSIVGFGELFELYSRNFLMPEFWALTLFIFAFALVASEAIGWIEHRIEAYASSRS